MLENINYIISATIMIITSIIFSMILLEKKKIDITQRKIIIIILSIIIYSFGIKYLNGTVKTLCLYFLYVQLFRYILKISYYDAILLTFMYIILIIIPDILVLLFSIGILKIEPEVFYASFAETTISSMVVNMLLIIITYIFRKILRKVLKIRPKNPNREIIMYIILTLGSILVIFYNAIADIKIISSSLLISVVIISIFLIILYSLIKQKMENDKMVESYDKLLEFIKKYEIIIEEQREARHESKNQLITIKSKVLNKDKEQEIIKYVDSILKDHIGYQEDKYGKFQYLPANGIKGLFYYKSMEAEEKGIKLSINIGEKVEKSIISKLDTEEFKQLGRILGVYLDNAIEASSVSEEKKLGIEVYMHKKDVVIIISNTYNGEIDEESIGKIRYTTKGKNHGYGLMLVNKILSKNNRFYSERQVTNNIYIQKLIIKKSIV